MDIRALLEQGKSLIGKTLTLEAWVKGHRDSKNVGFLELTDGTSFRTLQAVIDKSALPDFKVNLYDAVRVTGEIVESGGKQEIEMHVTSIETLMPCADDYPLQKKRHSFEFLREIAHLRPRTNTFQAVFRVRSLLSFAIHQFFQERGFVYTHTPIITGSDAEGAGEMFHVTTMDFNSPPRNEDGTVDMTKDFFGKPASLTVSGQLEGEAFALAFGKIYTFGPTFRAENSNTARHAAEFWMIEPEIAFADLSDNMDLAEDMVKYIISYVLEHAPDEMQFFDSFVQKGLIERLTKVATSEFKRMPYTEAIEILKASGRTFQYPVEWGADLQTEHERYLSEEVVCGPVFLTDYPKDIKAFYMRLNDDGKTVAACDLLVPGIGELIGGSQREERLDVLLGRMKEMGLTEEGYEWYLDLRRYGGCKHAGYGLGFERMVMYMTGMQNIRDVVPFARTVGNLEF